MGPSNIFIKRDDDDRNKIQQQLNDTSTARVDSKYSSKDHD